MYQNGFWNKRLAKKKFLEFEIVLQVRIQDFPRGGVQTLGKGQTNIKRKRNEYKLYNDDNFLIISLINMSDCPQQTFVLMKTS